MFDIGFSELLVIGIVALLVVGPERLPKVARTAGHLLGRLQRYVNDVKADIQREVELEELKKLRSQFEEAARSVEQSVHQVDQEIRSVGAEIDRSLSSPMSSATADTALPLPDPAAATAQAPAGAPPSSDPAAAAAQAAAGAPPPGPTEAKV